MAQTGRVRIRVTDPIGGVIPTAQALLLGSDSKPSRTAQANEAGEIVLTDLPFGDCRIAVVAPGFSTRTLTVTLRNGDEEKIETALDFGLVGEFVSVKTRRRWWHWLIFR
jgi:hypothetical protein